MWDSRYISAHRSRRSLGALLAAPLLGKPRPYNSQLNNLRISPVSHHEAVLELSRACGVC